MLEFMADILSDLFKSLDDDEASDLEPTEQPDIIFLLSFEGHCSRMARNSRVTDSRVSTVTDSSMYWNHSFPSLDFGITRSPHLKAMWMQTQATIVGLY